MSLANKVDEIVDVIQDDTYKTIEDMGGEIPEDLTIKNLSSAIASIPQGGGGSTVEWNQIQTEGEKIAEITIDEEKKEVFVPSIPLPGGSFWFGHAYPSSYKDFGRDGDLFICLGAYNV